MPATGLTSQTSQEALATSDGDGRPTAILARTRKGRGVAEVEDREGQHGKPVPDAEEAIRQLGGERDRTVQVGRPDRAGRPHQFPVGPPENPPPAWQPGTEDVATRTAFGQALVWLGHTRGDVVVLDGEVADSTRTEYFAVAYPERFFECYIAEQQLVAGRRGWPPLRADLGLTVADIGAYVWHICHHDSKIGAEGRRSRR
jgi:transketolase